MTAVTTSANGSRRAELAAFLRSRRERLSPEQVGLPPGLRRRTPGLRREEVAQLAGVGITWYTWLEQGRQIHASAQVLGAVAQTLRLDQAERQHLYRLADVADAAAGAGMSGSACEQVSPEIQVIMDSLVPLPASVLNDRYDLLGWNEAYAAVWPGMVGAQPGERNILWENFTQPDCCHPYVSRHGQLARLVAQFRSNYGRHVGEPAWTGFISRLQAVSPYFARLWEEHDVATPVTYLKIFQHPAFARLAMTSTSLGLLAVPCTRLVVYTPADEECRTAIGKLLAGEGADAEYACAPAHRRRRAELSAASAAAAFPAADSPAAASAVAG